MKKILVLLLSVLFVFSLMGCNSKNPLYDLEEEYVAAQTKGLSFKAEKETYTAEDTVINYTIQNNTEERKEIGNGHFLHYKTEDGWKTVVAGNRKTGFKINAVNFLLEPQQMGTYTINLSSYKPLEKGEYRIERHGMVSESFMVE